MSHAKLKAKELIEYYAELLEPIEYGVLLERNWKSAKDCALLVVDEIYFALYSYLKDTNELQNADREFAYWEEVKNEINLYKNGN
jgi:hypothetical protein